MSELRLCKEDFLQYRALEVQEKYYKKQLAELRDKYLIVDTRITELARPAQSKLRMSSRPRISARRPSSRRLSWKSPRNAGLSAAQ